MTLVFTIIAILLAVLFVIQYFRSEQDVNRLDVASPIIAAAIFAVLALLL